MRITPYSGATHNGSGNSLLFLTSLHSQLYLKEKCEGGFVLLFAQSSSSQAIPSLCSC